MTEEWLKWTPINGVDVEKYCQHSLHSDRRGLKIVLKGENSKQKICFSFEGRVASYRETDESFKLRGVQLLDEGLYDGVWTFFKIKKSLYVNSLSESSWGTLTENDYTHFCFITDESIIDVVANDDPKVQLIEDDLKDTEQNQILR